MGRRWAVRILAGLLGLWGLALSASAEDKPFASCALSPGPVATVARVLDAESGRMLWTAKATSPPSSDLNGQLLELTRTVFGALDKTALF